MTSTSRRAAATATLVGNSVTVGITVAQAFLLIPLCLVYLGPTLYGAWLAAAELLVWIPILDAGITNLLTQRVGAAVGRGHLEEAARWSSTGLIALVALGAVLLGLGLVVAPGVSRWLQVPIADRDVFVDCFRVGVVSSVLLLLSNGVVGVSRGTQHTTLINATQVGAALGGLLTSMVLVTSGWYLWALAAGLVARALLSVIGSVAFLATLPRAGASWWRTPSRESAHEIGTLAPSMSGASLGYVLANNSEILIISTYFGPIPALVYALTRRSFDGVRSLLDTFAWAVAGGFAHLVTSDDRHRSRMVLREVLWLRLSAACVAAAVVVAVNRPFVSLLFGAEHFGGIGLTIAFGVHLVVTGQAFLANFLLRSMGQVREGSLLLTAEAAARFAAMSGGLSAFGLLGAPWASSAASLVVMVIVRRRLEASLPATDPHADAVVPPLFAPVAVLALGIGVAWLALPLSWATLIAVALGIGVAGTGLLWLVHGRQWSQVMSATSIS